MFLTAPHSSTPTTSSFVYGRKYDDAQAFATSCAVASLLDATTVAVGCRWAISRARFGPETTATRDAGMSNASATTSLIRRSVDSSTPFISDTATASGASSERSGVSSARADCDGIAIATRSAPSRTTAGSDDAVTPAGRTIPGR